VAPWEAPHIVGDVAMAGSPQSADPSREEIRGILANTRRIAVVGLSDQPDRPSHRVAAYLKAQGFRIFPVNPNVETVLEEPAWPSLREVPEAVDVVNVFRRPEAVPEIVEDAIAIGASVIWMQTGVVHEQAAETARAAGLKVVMDRCIMAEHGRVFDG
jgi:uncharacterized protein